MLGAWVALVAASAALPPAAPAHRLDPFLARLRSHGRAEVRLERRSLDAPAGEAPVRGRAVLEPPDRARLEFDATHECVTLRSDGGEWLQPQLKQLVRLGPGQSRGALEWWNLLLGHGNWEERELEGRRILIVRGAEAEAADSAWVTLDTRGLPTLVEVHVAGGNREQCRLDHWSFGAARGRSEFVLAPPHGFEVVELR
jgi:hypothetical protein